MVAALGLVAPSSSGFTANRTPAVRRIVVTKSTRRLELWSGPRLVRSFRVALGLDPVNDKRREGDRRTPEGSFYITAKNAHSRFYRSLSLSYPNAAAAERGRKARLLTAGEQRQIMRALRNRREPPQHTALGGLILIHGGGSQRDWTWGCVALDNDDVDRLFPLVRVGTPVEIRH